MKRFSLSQLKKSGLRASLLSLLSLSLIFTSVSFVSCDNGSSDDSKPAEEQKQNPEGENGSNPSNPTNPDNPNPSNPDTPQQEAISLEKMFIIGDLTKGKWVEMTIAEDKKSASYVFVYDGAAMTKWGGGNGTGNFKISEFDDWDHPSYGGSGSLLSAEADKGSVELSSGGSMKNIVCTTFITENEYTITFVKTDAGESDGSGGAKGTIKVETSKMVHQPVEEVEVLNDFKDTAFVLKKEGTGAVSGGGAVSGSEGVIYFGEKQFTISGITVSAGAGAGTIDLSGTYDYTVDEKGTTATFKIGENTYSVVLSESGEPSGDGGTAGSGQGGTGGAAGSGTSGSGTAGSGQAVAGFTLKIGETEITFVPATKLYVEGKFFDVTEDDLNKCYIDNRAEQKILFLYDFEKWAQEAKLKSAYVRGSFTSWKDKPDYQMSYSKNLNLCYASVPYSKVSTIGNSGHPEYKFYINGTYMAAAEYDFITEGYCFHTSDNNLVVLFEKDDLASVIEQSNIAGKVKTLADFDLETRLGQEEISNFRLVPGTKKLFRSYHPYYPSRAEYATEKYRLENLQKLAVEEGIKSDINLTDDYTGKAGQDVKWADGSASKVEIPAYYQSILDNESVLNVKTAANKVPDYDTVYNKPDSDNFNEWVQVIVDFIIDEKHQAPFEIHCAIGTDRTGVFSALLGALCGATWNEVCVDYEKTNRMGINEYRSKALLEQSFRRMLGVESLESVVDLKASLWEHFENTTLNGEPVLTKTKLEALVEKLK